MKTTRRVFLKTTAATCGLLAAGCSTLTKKEKEVKTFRHIGIALQLYSVRDDCARDFDKTLDEVAAMGVEGVEFAGYHKYAEDAKGLKKQLDATGLKAVATFLATADLQGDALKRNIEFLKTIDCEVLTVGGDSGFCNKERNKDLADIFNKDTEDLKPVGLFCGYHNHAAEMTDTDGGKTWWDLFAERTSKDVILHHDVGWIADGGKNPVELIRKYPGRTRRTHLKTYVDGKIEGKKHIIGQDSLDWKSIIAACYEVGGTEWFTVEQEIYPDGKSPMECSDLSLKGFKAILSDTKCRKVQSCRKQT